MGEEGLVVAVVLRPRVRRNENDRRAHREAQRHHRSPGLSPGNPN